MCAKRARVFVKCEENGKSAGSECSREQRRRRLFETLLLERLVTESRRDRVTLSYTVSLFVFWL